MSIADREKWNRRYRDLRAPNPAARVLTDNRHLLPLRGEALELACGLGGNALELARLGLNTRAWDLSDVAIDRLNAIARTQQLPLRGECVDLDEVAIPCGVFDLILVSGFLDRPLCTAIAAGLRPGGLLLYQTFTQFKVGDSGPSNPAFLLAPGELLTLFSSLTPVAYREEGGLGDTGRGLRNQAYLVAQKP